MKVWIAERDVYDSKYIAGIYLTEERAIKAMAEEFKGTFTKDDDGWWRNDLDWEDHVSIRPMEVDE